MQQQLAESLEELAQWREQIKNEKVPLGRKLSDLEDQLIEVRREHQQVTRLLGLLGTVTGMLATFGALASGSGGEKTTGLVAKGISEALVTTETGLIIALPGLFFQYQLSRRLGRYRVFLARLETICTQKLYKKLHQKQKVTQKPLRQPEITVYEPLRKHDETVYEPL